MEHEVTTDSESVSAVPLDPASKRATEHNVIKEPKQRMPDQVCEPAASSIIRGRASGEDSMEETPD